ncbi:PREDICTED: cell cycle progression protein 1-like [Elephantulus edwardii]|uniref:cell cycle progression protein 1-like n=1 Tax=Elephantulus edwardii TaxID=28737 RepID=UPI0003F0CD37|nr:PREDICTED: cell cycle progression protein 1-like [Elephantulus edwardii]
MAEDSNYSDSDSSCDWTVISYEGSDIEMVNSEHGVASDNGLLVLEGSFFEHEEVQVLSGVNSQRNTMVMGEIAHPAVEETKSAVEEEEETPFEDIIYFGTVSDDSDIVTLEPPKLEEVGIQEEAVIVEEAESSETFHMASSFSSQYTLCQSEIAFSSQHNDDESRSDEIGYQPSPAEEEPSAEQEPEPCKENLDKHHFKNVLTEKKEIETLRERLTELERKLIFEQQRSDLWERLYVEAKDQIGKQETDGNKKGSRGNQRAQKKSKETFLGSVKETFDAVKNSAKEFVRHHKEKIRQAKEAVKENLKKFSDSVKSTFRHFKVTIKNNFEKRKKRYGAPKEAAAKKSRTVYRAHLYPQYKATTQKHQNRFPCSNVYKYIIMTAFYFSILF